MALFNKESKLEVAVNADEVKDLLERLETAMGNIETLIGGLAVTTDKATKAALELSRAVDKARGERRRTTSGKNW